MQRIGASGTQRRQLCNEHLWSIPTTLEGGIFRVSSERDRAASVPTEVQSGGDANQPITSGVGDRAMLFPKLDLLPEQRGYASKLPHQEKGRISKRSSLLPIRADERPSKSHIQSPVPADSGDFKRPPSKRARMAGKSGCFRRDSRSGSSSTR